MPTKNRGRLPNPRCAGSSWSRYSNAAWTAVGQRGNRLGARGGQVRGPDHGRGEQRTEREGEARTAEEPQQTRPAPLARGQQHGTDHDGPHGGHQPGVEVPRPGHTHHRRGPQPAALARTPVERQQHQRERRQAPQPHRVERAVVERPARQPVRGTEQARLPPAAGLQPSQPQRHDGRAEPDAQALPHVHAQVDLAAREGRDEQREGVAEEADEVRPVRHSEGAVPVEEEVAGRGAVQQVPQVGVEGHELVAEVVEGTRAVPEGIRAAHRTREDEGGHGDRRGQTGSGGAGLHAGTRMRRAIRKVTGIAPTAAISGAIRASMPRPETSTYTPTVVSRRFAAFVSGNSTNFCQLGFVR